MFSDRAFFPVAARDLLWFERTFHSDRKIASARKRANDKQVLIERIHGVLKANELRQRGDLDSLRRGANGRRGKLITGSPADKIKGAENVGDRG